MLVASELTFCSPNSQRSRVVIGSYFLCALRSEHCRHCLGLNQASPFRYRLNGRDVWIEIRVANIFDITDTNSAYIISTNTTFDASISRELISPQSLQGQFTEKYYDNEEHLESDLQKELAGKDALPMTLKGDRKGNRERHEIGTVVKIMSQEIARFTWSPLLT